MPRLFVALMLPETLRQRAAALRTTIPTARWVQPTHMHITLRFIGEVEDAQAAAVDDALASVHALALRFRVAGVGRFPPSPRKAPRVLWLGITPPDALAPLRRAVESALAPVGLPPEGSAFRPHLTLARLKTHKPTPEADRFLARNADYDAGPVSAADFALIESQLTPQGPVYTARRRYPLADSV